MEFLLLAFAAFLAGLIDSIAGGGGLLTLPAILLYGFPPVLALGTNKLQSILGTSMSLIQYSRHRVLLWRVALFGVPLALAGSWMGARFTLVFPPESLTRILVFILPPAAGAVYFSRALLQKRKIPQQDQKKAHGSGKSRLVVGGLCFSIGMYDGFFGPGTGTFLIVGLVLAGGLTLVHASATAKAFNWASNLGAVLVFGFQHQIDYRLGIWMALFNIGGNFLGSRLVIRRGNELVNRIVFVSLMLLFVYLFLKTFKVFGPA